MTQPPAAQSIVVDQADPVTTTPPVVWALERLRAVLPAGEGGDPTIVVAGARSPLAQAVLRAAGVSLPETPEAFALVPGGAIQAAAGRPVLLACAGDPRGLVYALLELADRIESADDPGRVLAALLHGPPLLERPANEIRSIMRLFTSDVEDLGWYHDRPFWQRYLTMLAAQRYNRFHLALGIGFDFARRMRDSYFYFPYPFLVDVPGYNVRASGVSDAERDRNLATLRFIAAETRRRGLHFQLGVWANVYEFEDSPEVNHTIEGLNPENHAPYCRDALRLILQAVPEIDGVTLRIHGESGIPEGSYAFWETLFAGVAGCGRRVEMDLHAKGIDQRMIDLALRVAHEAGGGRPVLVSPKFWAEHMGLPYHQAEIRALERPGPATGTHARLMALSIGERRFTRYGYADLLPENRPFGVLFRIWPGTHRLLLWGDPVTGRSYGRAFSFCGARGVELFEPLSFSGRRGSGLPSGRDPYRDASLRPGGEHGEWEKYAYTYRLWGRLLYNPDADPETWRRSLRRQFGPGALEAEAALSSASRILPLITTAHHPSAANNNYWPEMYTNMPIVEAAAALPPAGSTPPGTTTGITPAIGAAGPPVPRPSHPYSDTPVPKRFGTVSALDPELFSSVDEYVDELAAAHGSASAGGTAPSRRSGRYSPLEVARWLEELASTATRHLDTAASQVPDAHSPAFRRWAIDVRIEAALGRFYAEKLRAAVGYSIHSRNGDLSSLQDAVTCYRAARSAWAAAAAIARDVYKEDLTFGPEAHLRGHWTDRLPAIDDDVRALEALLQQALRQPRPGDSTVQPRVSLRSALAERRPQGDLSHAPPQSFIPGEPLPLELHSQLHSPAGGVTIHLHYRHVTQAERFQEAELQPLLGETGTQELRPQGKDTTFRGAIPASYTDSPYALQYYFRVQDADGHAWLWPGLGDNLATQPYFVVRASGGVGA